MGIAPVPRRVSDSPVDSSTEPQDAVDWVRIAACSSLIASGLLILVGQRRAGMVVAATGTTLAMIDQQATLRRWWAQLPIFADQVSDLIGQVQNTVDDVMAKRESLLNALGKVGGEEKASA